LGLTGAKFKIFINKNRDIYPTTPYFQDKGEKRVKILELHLINIERSISILFINLSHNSTHNIDLPTDCQIIGQNTLNPKPLTPLNRLLFQGFLI
jgi:hypothetical protein